MLFCQGYGIHTDLVILRRFRSAAQAESVFRQFRDLPPEARAGHGTMAIRGEIFTTLVRDLF